MFQSNLQMLLAHDPSFLDRLQYLLTQQALVVLAETPTTPNHIVRAFYARQVIQSASQSAVSAAVVIVGSTNLVAATTTITPGPPVVVTTDATDAAIFSEIATLWNDLAGVST